MRQLVTERISQAQDRIGELVGFTAQLQEAATRLGLHTPEGSCDEHCGCRTEPTTTRGTAREAVPLVGVASSPVACSLEPSLLTGRIDEWKATVKQAEGHEPLSDGIRLRFPRGTDVANLSQLAASEQTCCGFLTFTIGIHTDHFTLDVVGPTDAQPVIAAMFGPQRERADQSCGVTTGAA
jgi:hypothetical protein